MVYQINLHQTESSLTTPVEQDFFSDYIIPEELFLKILSYLAPEELLKVAPVSRSWNRITCTPSLWKQSLGMQVLGEVNGKLKFLSLKRAKKWHNAIQDRVSPKVQRPTPRPKRSSEDFE